jgi:hypothetical protein
MLTNNYKTITNQKRQSLAQGFFSVSTVKIGQIIYCIFSNNELLSQRARDGQRYRCMHIPFINKENDLIQMY